MEREDFRQGNAPLFIQPPENNVSYKKMRKFLHLEIEDLRVSLRRVQILVDDDTRMTKRRKRYIEQIISRAIDSDEEDSD